MNVWQHSLACASYAGHQSVLLEDDASCWSKQTQRDQIHVACPPISARMRKRRAFADKELENVMLERELQQNEPLYSALIPALHPPSLPVSPSLHCCLLNKESIPVGASSYVSVYKYKPVYECDFQFYQFYHLKGSTSAEGDYNGLLCRSSEQAMEDEERVCEAKDGPELILPPSQQRLKHHGTNSSWPELVKSPSETSELLDANGFLTNNCSISGSHPVITGGPDHSAASRTFDLLTATGWRTDTQANPAGTHVDSVKRPHGSPVRTPAAKPLPFSVEALLRAWQANGEQCSTLCWRADSDVW